MLPKVKATSSRDDQAIDAFPIAVACKEESLGHEVTLDSYLASNLSWWNRKRVLFTIWFKDNISITKKEDKMFFCIDGLRLLIFCVCVSVGAAIGVVISEARTTSKTSHFINVSVSNPSTTKGVPSTLSSLTFPREQLLTPSAEPTERLSNPVRNPSWITVSDIGISSALTTFPTSLRNDNPLSSLSIAPSAALSTFIPLESVYPTTFPSESPEPSPSPSAFPTGPKPSFSPTSSPKPSPSPSLSPTVSKMPSPKPTFGVPSNSPIPTAPSFIPTASPAPSPMPSYFPSSPYPSLIPTSSPAPSPAPTGITPTTQPSVSLVPSQIPTESPRPSPLPSYSPSIRTSFFPSKSILPSDTPTESPEPSPSPSTTPSTFPPSSSHVPSIAKFPSISPSMSSELPSLTDII